MQPFGREASAKSSVSNDPLPPHLLLVPFPVILAHAVELVERLLFPFLFAGGEPIAEAIVAAAGAFSGDLGNGAVEPLPERAVGGAGAPWPTPKMLVQAAFDCSGRGRSGVRTSFQMSR